MVAKLKTCLAPLMCISNMASKPIMAPGLEPFHRATEKLCRASFYRQFSTIINKYLKTGLNLIIFHFNIRGELPVCYTLRKLFFFY